jgi:hypothetical protein
MFRQTANGPILEEGAMVDVAFDQLTLRLRRSISRRAAVTGLGFMTLPGLADAKKRKRKKRKKTIKRNSFGCVNVGNFCKNSGQCCSGICEGKNGKKTCQIHDIGGCQTDQDACVVESPCPENPMKGCYRTTGNASVCGIGVAGACMACAKDADCEAGFGPGAACVICGSCPGEADTACVPTAL